jgi:DNA primase
VIEPFDLVYAIGDGDQSGREFAWRVRGAIPWARPVVLPEGRDLRDLLQAGDEQQLHDLLARG